MIPGSRRHISLPSRSFFAGLLAFFLSMSGFNQVLAEVSQQEQELLTVGVIDLDVNNVDEGEARAVSERLRIWLGRTGVFQVIERNQMDTIMEELGFQYSGACNTDECIVQVGQMLGATKMVAGSISKVGTLYSLQIRIVDITSSRIEHTSFRDEPGGMESVLMEATRAVADELADFVRGTSAWPPVDPVQPVTPATAQITIESTPSGATIIIDNQNTSQVTPASFPLTAGTHDLTLRLAGYTENSQSFPVVGGQDRTINTSLTEIYVGSAQLTIRNSLLGATLKVTGDEERDTALNNPDVAVDLPPGHFLLRVRAPGYAKWSQEVDLEDGDSSVIPVNLVPRSRFTAGILALIPGVGHFYANRPGKGVLMLVATAGSIVYGASQFGNYTTERDEYDQLVTAYRAATTYQQLTAIKTEMDAKHVEVQETHEKLGTVVGIIGGVWLFNIIDASLLMPRLRRASGSLPVPDIDLNTRNGRLTLSLRVNF